MTGRVRTSILAGCLSVASLIPGCASQATAPSATASPSEAPESAASDSPEPSIEAGGARPIKSGTLEAGVRYVSEGLGLSVQPVDDWYALPLEAGEFELTRERIAVWFTRPLSIRPDGTAQSSVEPPTDAVAFVAAVESHPAVTVTNTEPFEVEGFTGLRVDIESDGMSAGTAMVTTQDGDAFGFPDGEGRLLLLTDDSGLVMISIEGGESRDAAWSIAGPILEILESAP